MALRGASLAKDEFNAARMIARSVFPASAFVATRLVVVAVLQGTEPEDWQKIPFAGLHRLSKFIICLYGLKAFWRITWPVLPLMPLHIRPITGHEM